MACINSLHARLNKQYADEIDQYKNDPESGRPPFVIDPEISTVTSISSKNFINHYQENNGFVWGMTGTIGSELERDELHDKYRFKMQRIRNASSQTTH